MNDISDIVDTLGIEPIHSDCKSGGLPLTSGPVIFCQITYFLPHLANYNVVIFCQNYCKTKNPEIFKVPGFLNIVI